MRIFFSKVRLRECLRGSSPGPSAAQQATVTGSIRDAESGRPLAGVYVAAMDQAGTRAATAISSGEGRFQLTGLAPGSYGIRVQRIGWAATGDVAVTLDAGVTREVEIAMRPAAVALDPAVVSVGRRVERALEAPARVEVVTAQQVVERPATTPVDHVRSVPGIDVITTGVQSTNVVARGFNNIFSGSLHALTDHRIAGVPSLRVNLIHLVPVTNDDIERIEIVLGPGAALYGPNTAGGVMHILTRSPLTHQGSVVSVAGGERSLFHPTVRTAHRIGDNLGVKVSGSFLRADEWPHLDETEEAERAWALANRSFWIDRVRMAEGISQEEAEVRIERIGVRDEGVSRVSGEARVDWRARPDLTLVGTVGMTSMLNGVELTGLGAAQVDDWRYSTYQLRGTWNRLFGQVYLNASDAGGTYLLRNGSPIVDRSSLLVAQLQHGATLADGRFNLTYGTDFIHTMPRTEGTIHGRHEDDDRMTEIGAYLQSETALTSRLDLVAAGRIDHHSHLPEPVFSPRAALVFKPMEDQSLRLTFNQAFSTPSAINLFLDLGTPFPAEAEALSRLGYSVRVQGTAGGIRIRQPDGGYLMRSPWIDGGRALVAPNSVQMWQLGTAVLQGMGAIDAETAAFLMGESTGAAGIGILAANLQTGALSPLATLDVPDVEPIRESRNTTWEVGYRGLLGRRLLLGADLWHEQKRNFVTPLLIQTPFLVLDQLHVSQYAVPRLTQHFMERGMPQTQADAAAREVAGALSRLPLGVVSSEEVAANGAQALMTYRNFGEVSLWGSDLSATALVTDRWSAGLGGSWVSRDHFFSEGQLIALNAPALKGFAMLNFRDLERGVNAEGRVRFTDGFPAASGVYFGTDCIEGAPSALAGPCVDSFTLVDLTAGYRLPVRNGPTVQLTVQNVLGAEYRSFPGVPAIGRMAILRVRHEF